MKVTRVLAPVREQVVGAIRAEIIGGALQPGHRLIERELCEELDVSRNTLREALRQLEAEGFITITPYRGPTVAILSDDEARQVYEVREALECMAVRLFVERADAAAVERLRITVARLHDAHNSGEVGAMLDVKRDFYDALYAGCGNDVLHGQAALLQSRLYQLRARSLSTTGRPASSIGEIETVLACIQAGDTDGAVALWGQHIRRAAEAALGAAAPDRAAASAARPLGTDSRT
ncbi:GntR family transcriptional regulator [Pseudonocardia sp. MH-G8]|uniref:GntR family transcriptional regulator n=1 Tax=Pseudonocardia sp. MH-G8 TaxID=1854588 RepID=UPI000BA03A93|nr:GntR family transcriptional regulator [Pseudonocardia sp. MH-G8]OZM76886.1 GntR family transcriptional regulator [Pseudonocardia sp. MH-G8]